MTGEYEIKKKIPNIDCCIYNRGTVAANDGNISIKLNDNEFLCIPIGVSKGLVSMDVIWKVDAEGKVLFAN